MFKCAICGKEYSDKDMNEVRLLNRQTNELETYHVCGTCLDNKEDMVAYLADKKKMSQGEARHLYDYFVPMLDNIEAPLLEKYIESRVLSLRNKLAEDTTSVVEEEQVKPIVKKKMGDIQRLKIALIASDSVLSILAFTILTIICSINVSTVLGVFLGLAFGVALFVSMYFAIDSYIKIREKNYEMVKKVADLIPDKDEQDNN